MSKTDLCMSNVELKSIHLAGNSLQKHALSLSHIRDILNAAIAHNILFRQIHISIRPISRNTR